MREPVLNLQAVSKVYQLGDQELYALNQIDVKINCSTDALNAETKGFHWMACYGDYLKETGYALKKVGIEFLNLSA